MECLTMSESAAVEGCNKLEETSTSGKDFCKQSNSKVKVSEAQEKVQVQMSTREGETSELEHHQRFQLLQTNIDNCSSISIEGDDGRDGTKETFEILGEPSSSNVKFPSTEYDPVHTGAADDASRIYKRRGRPPKTTRCRVQSDVTSQHQEQDKEKSCSGQRVRSSPRNKKSGGWSTNTFDKSLSSAKRKPEDTSCELPSVTESTSYPEHQDEKNTKTLLNPDAEAGNHCLQLVHNVGGQSTNRSIKRKLDMSTTLQSGPSMTQLTSTLCGPVEEEKCEMNVTDIGSSSADIVSPISSKSSSTEDITPPDPKIIQLQKKGRQFAHRKNSKMKPKKRSVKALMNILDAASAEAKVTAEADFNMQSSPELVTGQVDTYQESTMGQSKTGKKQGGKRGRKGLSRKRKREADSSVDGTEAGEDNIQTNSEKQTIISEEEKPSQSDISTTQNQLPGEAEADRSLMNRSESCEDNAFSDDDNDDLVDPGLTPDSKISGRLRQFAIDEVVWIKCPQTKMYWPAVILEISGENFSRQSYKVVKISSSQEQPGSPFMVRPRTIKPFSARPKSQNQASDPDFENACDVADEYLSQLGLGKVVSYSDFLHQKTTYFDSPPVSPDTTCPPSPPLLVGHGGSSSFVDQDCQEEEEEEEEEGEEGRLDASMDDDCSGEPSSSGQNSLKLEKKWKQREDVLIKHIKSTHVLEHLIKIQQRKVHSERHEFFFSNNPKDKNQLRTSSLGALFTDEKQWDILAHLRGEFDKRGLLSSPSYMMEVAIPEALNFAYRKIKRVNKQKAEEIMHIEGQQVTHDLNIS